MASLGRVTRAMDKKLKDFDLTERSTCAGGLLNVFSPSCVPRLGWPFTAKLVRGPRAQKTMLLSLIQALLCKKASVLLCGFTYRVVLDLS